MGGLTLLMIFLFSPRQRSFSNGRSSGAAVTADAALNLQLFLLGAGFMLVETKAVVTMALLFGSTWVVNSVVFLAVLTMILLANLWTLRLNATRLWPYYAGLILTLALNVVIPLDFFLGMNRGVQALGASLLVFAPILFAGVIFAGCFKRTKHPDLSFGVNIAGAVLGGLAEYCSMLVGFQYLILIAMLFYAISAMSLLGNRNSTMEQRATGSVATDS
jgi:hypothetical protein